MRGLARPGGGLLLGAAMLLQGCASGGGGSPTPAAPAVTEEIVFAAELEIDLDSMERTAAGLYILDLAEADGFTARRTSLVVLHYIGRLPDGTVFDASVGGEPFQFRLGGNEVIRGWNQGIPGMKTGGRRRLVVPPALAYGSRGRGRVPPNSTLVFDIQLVEVR